jgi:hypothetical protein
LAWADLARWAWAHQLRRDAGETALLAVRLDPDIDGLDNVLVQLGYERDPELGWVPLEVAMERRGLVPYQGEWVTSERRSALEAEAARERAARLEAERQARAKRDEPAEPRPTANEVALASIDLARELTAGRLGVTVARASSLGPMIPVFIPRLTLSGGGAFWVGGGRDGRPPTDRPPANPGSLSAGAVAADWDALANRIPGSRLPISTFRQPQPR